MATKLTLDHAAAPQARAPDDEPGRQRGLSPIYLDDDAAPLLPMVMPRSRRRRIVFGWYGGKFNHLEWLLPLLPQAHHYCEPFAGSGAVLLNRKPAPIETYNDIDGEVVNFFRVLRDQGADLQLGSARFCGKRYRAVEPEQSNGPGAERRSFRQQSPASSEG